MKNNSDSEKTLSKMPTEMSDERLVAEFREAFVAEQESVVTQLVFLGELDRRKYFYHYRSLRACLVGEFHMEVSAAERKIRCARLLRRLPEIKPALDSGKLNITLLEMALGVAYRKNLSDPDLAQILTAISGLSCDQAQWELASLYPHPGALPKDRVRSLTSEHSELKFVVTQKLLERLEEIKDLMAHSYPSLSFGQLVELLANDWWSRHHPEEKTKRAAKREALKEVRSTEIETEAEQTDNSPVDEPKPSAPRAREPRVFTAAMVRSLILKDGYQCSYVDPITHQRCTSKRGIEVDHIQPYVLGGETSPENGRLICLQHHRRISFLQFGDSSRFAKK